MNSLRSWALRCRIGGRAAPAVARAGAAGALALLLASGFGARRAEAQSYTVTDLGTLGGTYSTAAAINNSGQVVGSAAMPGDDFEHAFLYDGTGMHDLGTFGGLISYGNGINDRGQIVGDATTSGGMIYHAFLYDATGMHDLGTLGGGNSYANAIAAGGQAVGHGPLAPNLDDHALLFDSSGTHDLGTLPGAVDSVAYGINAVGQVVGSSRSALYARAFLYDSAGMHDLGTLGGTTATARAINDAGQVIGDAEITSRAASHAFLYDRTGMHDLGTLSGQNSNASSASGINRAGQVVGASADPTAPDGFHAFMCTAGVMLDLNTFIPAGSGWLLSRAFGINDHGQIVGEGFIGGHRHAFLMTPPMAPSISLDAVTLDLGSQGVGTTSAAQLVTVTNPGTAPLTIQQVTVTGSNAADFSAGAELNGATLGPGESRTVSVRFRPEAVGGRSARLAISDNAAGSPHGLDLTGSGVGPVLQISPTTVGFGFQIVGAASDVRTVQVTNTGNAPLPIGAVGVEGAAAADFAPSTALAGTTLAPGQSGTITLHFTPAARGARTAVLTITDNADGSPHLIPLIGVGVSPDGSDRGYSVIDLGTLGGKNSEANGLNNLGQVVGQSDVPTGPHAFLYDGAGMRDLGTFGGYVSIAHGINDAGQVVGEASTDGGHTHAFLYDGTGLHDLSPFLGATDSLADAINASGQITGTMSSGGDGRAFRYRAGVVQNLGAVGYSSSEGWGINDAGHVVGRTYVAFLSDGSNWQSLGTLGGVSSLAHAVNVADQVVGESATASSTHAFLYDGAGMHDLGTLAAPFDQASYALSINAAGQIVGYALGPHPDEHAILWDGGQAYDLNNLIPAGSGWEILEARSINDRGQIAGVGRVAGGAADAPRHALLLTPISETIAAPPQAPSGLSVKLPSLPVLSELDLTWSDNSNNETGFEIQRRRIWSDWATVATVGPDTTTFSDTQVGAYIHYIYRVRAVNTAGASAWSAEASGDVGIGANASLGWDARDFGSVVLGSSSAPLSLPITNAGTGPLLIQSVSLGGADPGEFAVTASPTTIAPGETAAISLVFTPATLGSRSAEVTITSNATNTVETIRLSGTGSPPSIASLGVSPSSLSFGPQPVGTSSGAQPVILQNTGTVPVDISTAQIQGAAADDFKITADGATGAHLLPGHVCSVNISFTPAAAGSRAASLVINDTAQGSPHVVPLTGEGTAADVSLSATTLSFGDQPVGTSGDAQSVTFTNSGSAPLKIYSVVTSGADPGDFPVGPDLTGVTLAPGESRTIAVRFKPAAAGSRAATLLISDSAAGSPHTVGLSGTGTAPSVTFGISRLTGPGSLSFGAVTLGASSTQTLTLTNSGSAPLTIGSITLSGASAGDYQITAGSGATTLAPGGTRTLTLRFAPLALGDAPASLTITDNAAGGQQSVGLAGTGILPGPSSHGAALIPTSGELFIAAVDGTAGHSSKAVVSVGQSVTVKLQVKFPDGAVADVSADRLCAFGTGTAVGTFTAKNIWLARPQDQGKTVVISGSYRSPVSGRRITGMVMVTVRAVRRRR